MKTIRIYLSLLAFVLAFGGATASSFLTQNPVYQFIDNPGIDECRSVDLECQTTVTTHPCQVTLSGPVLKDNPMSTSCGNTLWRTTAPSN